LDSVAEGSQRRGPFLDSVAEGSQRRGPFLDSVAEGSQQWFLALFPILRQKVTGKLRNKKKTKRGGI